MALNGLQVFGFSLGILSWAGMIGICCSPEWRRQIKEDTYIDSTLIYDGLWTRCQSFATGQTHCGNIYQRVDDTPSYIKTCRALVISSIVIGFIAILVTIFGLKCVTIGSKSHVVRARIAFLGGILFATAGIGVAVALYYAFLWAASEGYDVTTAFYVAMATAGLTLISSSLVIAGSCPSASGLARPRSFSQIRTFSLRKLSRKRGHNSNLARRCTVASSYEVNWKMGSKNLGYKSEYV